MRKYLNDIQCTHTQSFIFLSPKKTPCTKGKFWKKKSTHDWWHTCVYNSIMRKTNHRKKREKRKIENKSKRILIFFISLLFFLVSATIKKSQSTYDVHRISIFFALFIYFSSSQFFLFSIKKKWRTKKWRSRSSVVKTSIIPLMIHILKSCG